MTRTLVVTLALLTLAAAAYAGQGDALRKAVRDSDRIRVRSGGTCHRLVPTEKTLFESKEAAVIRDLLAAIEIDDDRSGFHCMCCGNPTFEFYRGNKLLAMVGFHHGQSLRWSGGGGGDVALTRQSALRLCRWLDARGVTEPLKELEEAMLDEAAMREYWRRLEKILPDSPLRALRAAESYKVARDALTAALPDPVERAVVCFRLLGCHEGKWSVYTRPDQGAEVLLEETPAKVLGKALSLLGDDPWALTGAARFLFEGRHEGLVPADALNAALPVLAARALAHPRRECRRSAMAGIARIGGPAALAALRPVLAGEVKIRVLPETDRGDPGFIGVSRGQAKEVHKPEDDRVAAAWLLFELGDHDSGAATKALIKEAAGEDREVLEALLVRIREREK